MFEITKFLSRCSFFSRCRLIPAVRDFISDYVIVKIAHVSTRQVFTSRLRNVEYTIFCQQYNFLEIEKFNARTNGARRARVPLSLINFSLSFEFWIIRDANWRIYTPTDTHMYALHRIVIVML